MPLSTNALLARLKCDTQVDHDAIEVELRIPRTIAEYRTRLARLYGFYQPLEKELGGPWEGELNLANRLKTNLLEADLATLGSRAGTLPTCGRLPHLTGAPERWGCHYVLEGATLGGRIIGKQIAAELGVTPTNGGRFFYGYGERTGEMWRAFRAELDAFAACSAEHDRVVAAACSTFRALRLWCNEGMAPP
jgi:heme oxygenase (biliverdin-IX-beta and delta-forming)